VPREGAGLLLKRYRALVGPEIAPTGSFRFYFPAVWKWSQKNKQKIALPQRSGKGYYYYYYYYFIRQTEHIQQGSNHITR